MREQKSGVRSQKGERWESATDKTLAVGVDLGGTKLEVAVVDAQGQVRAKIRRPTDVKGGPAAVIDQVISGVAELRAQGLAAGALGVGVAGQIEAESGVVRFAPNLGWSDVPLQASLSEALDLPVVVTNDVRAATWGEWLHGAGKGCDDLVCMFVGTGIGGGVVCGGRVLTGCSNTAGEIGHMVVDFHGPPCDCGGRGCLEALAGGRALARRARKVLSADPAAGRILLELAGGKEEAITAEVLAQAWRRGDLLAQRLLTGALEALVAGSASLINAFNPCRLILGGGVMEGLPEWVERIEHGLRRRALEAACASLEVLPAQLRNEAGVVGAASLALRVLRGGFP